MKPAILVKTKQGKRYLQIKTVDGDLIHIGPASVLENWQIAFAALENEYEGLVILERQVLCPIIEAEGLDYSKASGSIGSHSEKWQNHIEKVDKKYNDRRKTLVEERKNFGLTFISDTLIDRWWKMLQSRSAKQDPVLQQALLDSIQSYRKILEKQILRS